MDLKSLTRDSLRDWVQRELGEPAFRGDQIFRWVHGRGVRGFEEMTDLSRDLRERLEGDASLGGLRLDEVRVARDGTKKLLLSTARGERIESVIIPMEDRWTQCVSSQVGCKIGCDFCLTARMPTRRSLSPAEIVDQVHWAAHVMGQGQRVQNLVFMGMGEPLDNYDGTVAAIRILMDDQGPNYSSRRITVSTSGVVPKMVPFGNDVPVNLAVSLNATTDEQRTAIIPINKVWPIASLMEAMRAYPLPPRRRITVEYVMLGGFNDADDDARRLAVLLRGLRCKVNLIPFNAWEGSSYKRPEPERVDAFGRILRDARYSVTVRYSKGEDIGAACGQLDGDAVTPTPDP